MCGFDKKQVRNRVALFNGSGKNAQFVFTQLINVFASDMRTNKTSTKSSKLSDSDDAPQSSSNEETEYVSFEQSYIVSVHYHICQKHFTDICAGYRTHIQKHYDINPNKVWRKCDLGCEDIENDLCLSVQELIGTHKCGT